MELVQDPALRAHLAEMAEVKLEFRQGLRMCERHPTQTLRARAMQETTTSAIK
jgi:hypothetical protein